MVLENLFEGFFFWVVCASSGGVPRFRIFVFLFEKQNTKPNNKPTKKKNFVLGGRRGGVFVVVCGLGGV